MVFVNPYTFIRFPTEVRRRPGLGHAPTREQAEERYTGTLTVTWKVKSPLAVPNDGSWGLADDNDSELRIPGASVKGAVRSLHEALFAGCARIVDPGFTPVYRDMMTTGLLEGWQLGVVMTPDAHAEARPDPQVKVIPCGQVSWTRGDAVAEATAEVGRLPRTGDFIEPADSVDDNGRRLNRQVAGFTAVDRDQAWGQRFVLAAKNGLSVILVTDTAARDSRHPYYWATAKPGSKMATVVPSALVRFRQRLRGADRQDGAGVFEDVHFPPGRGQNQPPGPAVAQRRTVDGWLRQGDVIWVKVQDGQVIDIKLSLGWRVPAGGKRPALGDRIPSAVRPCRHYDQLCLSCVIFGSVDAEAKSDRDGTQHSYGGHVRFGDIVGLCSRVRRNVELAPLGTPHPGAGMYYLTPVTKDQMAATMERPDFPSRWDSIAGESRGPRNLRGRKFYWHSDPNQQKEGKRLGRARYERQQVHTNDESSATVHIVSRAQLTQSITFDGLDATALASLLATLNPELLLGNGDFALHLGRGKPLGLGSVQADVNLKMTTTADRYSQNPTLLTRVPSLAACLTDGVAERCGLAESSPIRAEARSVLALDGLGDRAVDVSYPTMRGWSDFRTAEFHQSFEFFQKNSGQVKKDRRTKQLYRDLWKPLPGVTDRQGQE